MNIYKEEKRHLIGFSLSLCIKDILEGKVKKEEVLFIQTACNPRGQDDINDIIEQYLRTYWCRFTPDAVKTLINEFLLDQDYPRIGWAHPTMKNCVPLGWGKWLSINNAL